MDEDDEAVSELREEYAVAHEELRGEVAGGGKPAERGAQRASEPEAVLEEEETYEYTEQQVREMRLAFAEFDIIRNDTIPICRLGDVLRALALNPTEAQLRDAGRWLEADPERGVVRFNEFLVIMGRALKDPVTVDAVLEGFQRLDENKTGVLERALLADVLTTTGERFYPNEFAAFIKHADPKKRGLVKYEDFVRRMGGGKIKLGKRKFKKKSKKRKVKKKKMHREATCNQVY